MALTHPNEPAPGPAQKAVVITDSDLVFYCPHCEGELVVDRQGIGLEVDCPHCQKTLTIPDGKGPPAAAPTATEAMPAPAFDFSGHSPEQIAQRQGELNHQLKENQSQDTEMRGHINRATIELHRLQLRHKKLQDRKMSIAAELAALRDAAAAAPAVDP